MSSITPIPELERLLDEKADAERALRQPAPTYADLTLGRTYPFRRDDLYDALTDDTIRALVNVAGEGVCPICHMRMAEGVYRNEDDEHVTCPAAYHAALAPLVKEATDDRA